MKFFKNNKILFYCLAGILILLIIVYFFYHKNYNDYDSLKEDKSKKLVYTIEKIQSGNYIQYIPYLNINDTNSSLINNDMYDYINNYNENNNVGVTYEYNINGKILSLVLKIEDHSYVEGAIILHFKSYNIDLDTLEVLADDNILSFFDIDSAEVGIVLNKKINDYYNNLVNNSLINANECDYDCFLNSRSFNNNEDIEYYIRDGKLVVFKPYTYIIMAKEKDIVYDFEIK